MNSKKTKKSWLQAGAMFVALVILSMAVVADASVYAGPSWRGGAGTTFEQWSFSSSSTESSPDAGYVNQYGTPDWWIGSRATYLSSLDTYTGVWTPGTDEMDLQIPNTSNTGANTEKTIC